MMRKNYLFEDHLLPEGFKFPPGYLALVESDLPDIEPWWWLAPYKDLSVFWNKILKEQFPSRTLVPFAKYDASDDVMCFDGSDTSGDPQVLVIHSFCDPGWEHRGDFVNFSEWLRWTLEKSAEYKNMEKEE
jgi:hypothetical protein